MFSGITKIEKKGFISVSDKNGPYEEAKENNFNLDEFTLLNTIGMGAYSRVRLAFHNPTQKFVALKIVPKQTVSEKNKIQQVVSEKQVLTKTKNPFVVKCFGTFQDRKCVYFVLEYVAGGELYRRLRDLRALETARFYSAEVCCALLELHANDVVYRDLKPENVLLDASGHAKLVDLGCAKEVKPGERTYSLCGTLVYLPPETILGQGHNSSADWWTFGVFLYEMLTGSPPFLGKDPHEIQQNILNSPVCFPQNFDKKAKDLIQGLLCKDPKTRIKDKEVKLHPFFSQVNWDLVKNKLLSPPITPKLRGPDDVSNFKFYPNITPSFQDFDLIEGL